MDTVDNAITKPVHRLEVFTGAGRRRSFSDEDKARIVAEILTSNSGPDGVMSPQQLLAGAGKYEKPKLSFLRQRDCGSRLRS